MEIKVNITRDTLDLAREHEGYINRLKANRSLSATEDDCLTVIRAKLALALLCAIDTALEGES